MKNDVERLIEWIKELGEFSLPSWDQLPEMDLYMDQVMTYMDKKLAPLTNDNFDKVLTPFMVNNYVKSGLIPCPIQKRYNKDQIAYLLGICSIKQVLSIADITTLFDLDSHKGIAIEKTYQYFQETQHLKLHEVQNDVFGRIKILEKKYQNDISRGQEKEADSFLNSGLALIAYKLAIEAQIKKTIADQIFNAISPFVKPKTKDKLDRKTKKAEKKENKKLRKQLKKHPGN